MSFPFVQPYFGLGNSLQTAQAGGAGGVGGWVELARTTLGSAGNSIDVTSLDDKRYYWVLSDLQQVTGNIGAYLRNNGDTGNNYANLASANGGSDQTFVSTSPFAFLGPAGSTGYGHNLFISTYVSNLATKEKLYLSNYVGRNTAGAANAPVRGECAIKHAQTTNPISQFNMDNVSGGSYNTGSEVVVLGWDPADSHTTNFWEELASVTLGTSGDQLSSGSFSAKKYLWVQVYTKNSSTTNAKFTFNNDTGSNYAYRYSSNGLADGTATSSADFQVNVDNAGAFYNMFIVNDSAKEKLVIGNTIDQVSTGSATAPSRLEWVSKWANTSSQVTEIDVDNTSGGSYDTGSIIKVWGSD
jgi:hypothetical protein